MHSEQFISLVVYLFRKQKHFKTFHFVLLANIFNWIFTFLELHTFAYRSNKCTNRESQKKGREIVPYRIFRMFFFSQTYARARLKYVKVELVEFRWIPFEPMGIKTSPDDVTNKEKRHSFAFTPIFYGQKKFFCSAVFRWTQ